MGHIASFERKPREKKTKPLRLKLKLVVLYCPHLRHHFQEFRRLFSHDRPRCLRLILPARPVHKRQSVHGYLRVVHEAEPETVSYPIRQQGKSKQLPVTNTRIQMYLIR